MERNKMNSNRTVVDLNKVQYADFYWTNGVARVPLKPRKPTVNGVVVGNELAGELEGYHGETMLERAKRRDMLDNWVPVCKLQLTANHSLTYTLDKAKSIYKEFCRRQFKRKK